MQTEARFVIELNGRAAGVVVAEDNRYRFFAAGKAYAGLDRRIFRTAAQAEAACRRLTIGNRAYDRRVTESGNPHIPRNSADTMVGG